MPETKLKELHLAKCLDDLDKKCNAPDLKEKRARPLCKSAHLLFERAELERKNGDEELSYIYYMRYLKVVSQLRDTSDYKTNKTYVLAMINVKNPDTAMNWAEKLKDSLKIRYTTEIMQQKGQHIDTPEAVKKKMEDDRRKAMELEAKQHFSELPDENAVTITCSNLFQLLKDFERNIMVLDARPSKDYIESHIKLTRCISVPEEHVTAGSSANKLEQNLPPESLPLWYKREYTELIVLMDWSSTDIVPGKTLHTLKAILLKWDRTVIYSRPPVILEGGYEEWLLRYPTYTTNPRVTAPNYNTSLDDFLNDVDYPNLNESFSSFENKQFDSNISPNMNTRGYSNFMNNVNPNIDRSSKAAALQIYDSNSRAVKEILEEQEKLADSSLNIERRRISAEHNWEKIRLTHEKEAEEGMRANLQLREQELISELMQLENVQRDMAMENQQLKEQLEEYKKRERLETELNNQSQLSDGNATGGGAENLESPHSKFQPENVSNLPTAAAIVEAAKEEHAKMEAARVAEEAMAKERRIREMEEETARLDREREILQLEREKKLAEAREQKKLLYQKMLEDDEAASKESTPQIDRNTKPHHKATVPSDFNQARQRDFQGVWGRQGRGLTGLKNLGNTCYMNSIMQCLSNTSVLVQYFCEGVYRDHVGGAGRGTGGTQGAVAEEVAAVVRTLWSGQFRFISTKDLREVVGRFQPMFRGVEQQDSHEFLTILMDWLHNDLQIPSRQESHLNSLPPWEKAWQEYTKSKESLILRLFYGQIKSTVKCMVCGKESITYESFSSLSLELPAKANKCSLGDCLDLYLSDERIMGWNCPSCKDKRNAVKKLDISRLPPVLIIHFKRFYVDPKDYLSNTYRKKQTYIDFPLQNLDMGLFSLQASRGRTNTVYNLYGVSNHYGSMEGGHYTAYCKSSVHSKWCKFDDHLVTEITPSDVKSSASYILFYTSLPDSALQR